MLLARSKFISLEEVLQTTRLYKSNLSNGLAESNILQLHVS